MRRSAPYIFGSLSGFFLLCVFCFWTGTLVRRNFPRWQQSLTFLKRNVWIYDHFCTRGIISWDFFKKSFFGENLLRFFVPVATVACLIFTPKWMKFPFLFFCLVSEDCLCRYLNSKTQLFLWMLDAQRCVNIGEGWVSGKIFWQKYLTQILYFSQKKVLFSTSWRIGVMKNAEFPFHQKLEKNMKCEQKKTKKQKDTKVYRQQTK